MLIVAPTSFYRTTLLQEVSVLVGPSEFIRKITVFAPRSPITGYALDVDPQALGFNAFYKLCVYDSEVPLRFQLFPGQWLVGASKEKQAEVSTLVEFFAAPRPNPL